MYSSAAVVLSDAWPDMEARGFISNRVFDVALCAGTLLSHDFVGADLFPAGIHFFRSPDELRQKAMSLQSSPPDSYVKNELRSHVLQNHTFKHRARELHQEISRLLPGDRQQRES